MKKIVSSVATVSRPMMAMAIGAQKMLLVSGIIASTVAAAVNATGRVRWTLHRRPRFKCRALGNFGLRKRHHRTIAWVEIDVFQRVQIESVERCGARHNVDEVLSLARVR